MLKKFRPLGSVIRSAIFCVWHLKFRILNFHKNALKLLKMSTCQQDVLSVKWRSAKVRNIPLASSITKAALHGKIEVIFHSLSL